MPGAYWMWCPTCGCKTNGGCGCAGPRPKCLNLSLNGFDLPPVVFAVSGGYGHEDPCVDNVDGDYQLHDGMIFVPGQDPGCTHGCVVRPCAYGEGYDPEDPSTGSIFVWATLGSFEYPGTGWIFPGDDPGEPGIVFVLTVGLGAIGNAVDSIVDPLFLGLAFVPKAEADAGGCFGSMSFENVAEPAGEGYDPNIIEGATATVTVLDDEECDEDYLDLNDLLFGTCNEDCDFTPPPDTTPYYKLNPCDDEGLDNQYIRKSNVNAESDLRSVKRGGHCYSVGEIEFDGLPEGGEEAVVLPSFVDCADCEGDCLPCNPAGTWSASTGETVIISERDEDGNYPFAVLPGDAPNKVGRFICNEDGTVTQQYDSPFSTPATFDEDCCLISFAPAYTSYYTNNACDDAP